MLDCLQKGRVINFSPVTECVNTNAYKHHSNFMFVKFTNDPADFINQTVIFFDSANEILLKVLCTKDQLSFPIYNGMSTMILEN